MNKYMVMSKDTFKILIFERRKELCSYLLKDIEDLLPKQYNGIDKDSFYISIKEKIYSIIDEKYLFYFLEPNDHNEVRMIETSRIINIDFLERMACVFIYGTAFISHELIQKKLVYIIGR